MVTKSSFYLKKSDDMLSAIDRSKYLLVPNTSGARDAEEAVRLAKLARVATGINWLKLEVTPDPYYLLPDPVETLKAAETLVKEDFVVLPYITFFNSLAVNFTSLCIILCPFANKNAKKFTLNRDSQD